MILDGAGAKLGWVVEIVGVVGVIGVLVMGMDDGGDVRDSCLLGLKVVVFVLLSLLKRFLTFLFLVWALGVIFCLSELEW